MPVGMREVAAAVGVSMQTVSNVLHGREGASEETRQRVLEASRRLGYRWNGRHGPSHRAPAATVCLLVVTSEPSFPATSHQSLLLAGITAQLLEDNGAAATELRVVHDPGPSPETFSLLRPSSVSAAIVALVLPRLACRRWVDAIERAETPCVLIEHVAESPLVACVVSDQQQGALEATQHLLRQGHRRIALLTGPRESGDEERRLGYHRGMALWGIGAPDRLVLETDGTIIGGYEAMATQLKRSPRPTAVLAMHDLLALGTLEAARTAGLRVPDDLAVVGFEDMEFAAHLDRALSSVRLPSLQLGRTAVKLATQFRREGGFSQHLVVLPTSLHVRATSVADGDGPKAPGHYQVDERAPAPGRRPGPFRVGVSLISVDNPWRVSMHEQLVVEGEREPEIAELLVRDADRSVERQREDVASLIAAGVDALVVDPGAGQFLVPVVEEADAAGIPVIMLASTVPTDRFATKVGPDEVMVGKIVAEDLVARLGSGDLVILEGPQGWPVVEERGRGMALVLRQHRDIRVLATAAVPQWSRQRAKEIMRDWLLVFPKIDGVLAHDGLMAIGALDAAEEVGRASGLRLGFAGTYNRALQHLAERREGLSVLIPTWIGAECLRVALRFLRGEPVPKRWDMGVTVITPDNVADWYDPSKPGESFDSLIHE